MLMNPSISIAESKIHEPFLDGLRGIAILMVLFFHAAMGFFNGNYSDPHFLRLEGLARGVQLFFVLSALTLTLSTRERIKNKSHSIFKFFLRRAIRILPLWWLAVFLYSRNRTLSDSLATAFFYFGFFPSAWNVATVFIAWSLFVEECFYLIFPILIIFIKSIRGAFIAFIVSLGVSHLWSYFCERSGLGDVNHFQSIFPLHDGYAFFIGILLAFFLPKFREFFGTELNRISKYLLISIDLLAVISCFFIFQNLSRRMGTFAVVPLILASITPYSALGWLTRRQWLQSFGVCCYSIYLWHVAVLQILSWYREPCMALLGLSDSSIIVRAAIWFIPVALLNLVVGRASFRLLERPLVRWGANFISKKFANS